MLLGVALVSAIIARGSRLSRRRRHGSRRITRVGHVFQV
jgi:hypothetical protein